MLGRFLNHLSGNLDPTTKVPTALVTRLDVNRVHVVISLLVAGEEVRR